MSTYAVQCPDRAQTHTPDTKPLENPFNLRHTLEYFERRHVSNVLQLTGWDLDETANLLGVTRRTVLNKIKKYNLRSYAG